MGERDMRTQIIGMMCLMVLFMALPALAVENKAPAPYMGQEPPGLVPKVFAPGLISLPNRYEHDICFSKDGRECYFTIRNAKWTVHKIMVTRYENGHWNQPVPAPIGPHQGDWGCHISSLGNLWFCSWRPGGRGKCDLWVARPVDKQFKEAINLRDLNTSTSDCYPVPGPNENYFVWSSDRAGGFGKSDLYISFADGQGGWTTPKNLGPTINTSGGEAGPYLSPDHKYLFFSRCDALKGNSEDEDIYWVSVEAFLRDPNKPASNKND